MKQVTVAIALLICAATLFASGANEGGQAGEPTETREVSWHYLGGKQQDEEMVWAAINEELEAREGIRVDFQRSDWGAYEDRMNVMLASGEPMDIVFTANWQNNFYERVANGAFLPLNQLLEEHAPALLRSLPDFLLMAGEIDGTIYAVPNYQTIVTQHALATTQELADEYDLDVDYIRAGEDIIDQISRLEPYLRAIHEGEPDLYPYNPMFLFYGIWEQVPGTPINIRLEGDEFEVLEKAEGDAIKQRYDEIYRDWLREGLIREDIATVQNVQADIDQLRYGVWRTGYKPGIETELEIQYGRPMLVIPLAEAYVSARAGDGTMNAITVNSKEPEAAVRVLEVFNTDVEMYNMLVFGIEGVHYNKVGTNRIEQIRDDSGNSAYHPNTAWLFGNQFNAYLLPGQPDDLWEVTDELNRTANVSPIRGFLPDIEPVKNLIAQHSAADEEYWGSEWLYLDDDARYEAMQQERYEKTMAAGYPEIRQEIVRQLEEWLALTGR
ncbi:MAG: ABC transporter substrate-binding protein [Spirochaetales bacterium]